MSAVTNFQPLYKQVYDMLTGRLISGDWKPSDPLPSEMALADELGVSQGTVRKALSQMESEKLLERRQGKGTYVAEHTQESSLFRFFRLREPAGESLIPETQVLSRKRRSATREEKTALGLSGSQQVMELHRLRSLQEKPTIIETIVQPLSVFPGIDKETELPNSMYTLYQERYGICIVEVRDEIRATALPAEMAGHLNLPANAPVLMVERSSINIDGRTVEWSRSYSNTADFVYQARHK